MTLLLIRTVILYFLTLIALKAMGKRQLGQLQPFDFVILLIISETASLAMQSNTLPLIDSVLPITILTLLQILISLASLKSEKLRNIICGKPIVLIKNGHLHEEEMAKLRVDIYDILEQCRIQGYFDITELETVLMETNGQLSIRPKTASRPLTVQDIPGLKPQEILPYLVILDGHINHQTLHKLGYNQNWLDKRLAETTAGDPATIFVAGVDSNGQFFWQPKEEKQ
ncbi:MAG: DUF421 domain-containing protein [Clostridiales bacterium]